MTWAKENRWWLDSAAQNWAVELAESLRVRAWLASPLAWEGGYNHVTLEGALQSAVVLKETGRTPDDVFSDCPLTASWEETDIRIPVSDITDLGAIPIAAASVGVLSSGAIPSVRWRRSRPRAEYYQSKKVTVGCGPIKANNIPASVACATYVDFYVEGDRDKIEALLPSCTHLGARRSGGLGQVWGWEVTPHENWSLFSGPRLMRPVPAIGPQPEGTELRQATLRAPYWHQRTRTLCYVPIFEEEFV